MASILDKILAAKRLEVTAARERVPLADLERLAADAPPTRGFAAARLHRPRKAS